MNDFDARALLIERDIHLFLNARVWFDILNDARSRFTQLLPFDRRIVQLVSPFDLFRRVPESVTAADHPFLLASFADLIVELLEDIRAAHVAVANDARSDIKRDDQLDITI